MKKILLIICLVIPVLTVQAQFEKGTHFVNPGLTGFGLSYSGAEKTHFGLEAQVGTFMLDNVALLVNLKGDWKSGGDTYGLGVGGRYYISDSGIYLGAGLNLERYTGTVSATDFNLGIQVGYAYFLSKTVTVEPAVYYNQSFNHHSDFSKFGVKIGFGFYF